MPGLGVLHELEHGSVFEHEHHAYRVGRVKGPEQHPLYARLTGKESEFPGDIKWNFGKFLIGRDGKILKRFDSGTTPESPELTSAIETALAGK